MATWEWEEGQWELLFNEHRDSVGDDKKLLNLDGGIVAQ